MVSPPGSRRRSLPTMSSELVEGLLFLLIRVLCLRRVWSLKRRALAQARLRPATRAMEEYAAIFIRRLWRFSWSGGAEAKVADLWDLIRENNRRNVRAKQSRDEVEFNRVIADLELAMDKMKRERFIIIFREREGSWIPCTANSDTTYLLKERERQREEWRFGSSWDFLIWDWHRGAS